MKIIGIDIGTTTISAVVMDSDNLTVVYKRTIKNDSFLPTQQPWARIQNVHKIIASAKTMLEKILRSFDDISAIGLTGQMHGVVYIDQHGKAVSPLYTWQDGCGNLPDFDGKSICDILAQDYGISASTGYGMVTYLYHSRKGLVPRDASSFCTISDHLGMELTGRTTSLVHISQAAGMGLFDHKSMDFSREILARNGALQHILSDMFGLPLTVEQNEEEAALGAAISAFAMIESISMDQWLGQRSF